MSRREPGSIHPANALEKTLVAATHQAAAHNDATATALKERDRLIRIAIGNRIAIARIAQLTGLSRRRICQILNPETR